MHLHTQISVQNQLDFLDFPVNNVCGCFQHRVRRRQQIAIKERENLNIMAFRRDRAFSLHSILYSLLSLPVFLDPIPYQTSGKLGFYFTHIQVWSLSQKKRFKVFYLIWMRDRKVISDKKVFYAGSFSSFCQRKVYILRPIDGIQAIQKEQLNGISTSQEVGESAFRVKMAPTR